MSGFNTAWWLLELNDKRCTRSLSTRWNTRRF